MKPNWIFAVATVALLMSCSRSKQDIDEHATDQLPKGHVAVTAEALAKSGITIEAAGPAVLRKILRLNGKIVPNEERMAEVSPRFPGVVKSIAKRLGDSVKTDDL